MFAEVSETNISLVSSQWLLSVVSIPYRNQGEQLARANSRRFNLSFKTTFLQGFLVQGFTCRSC